MALRSISAGRADRHAQQSPTGCVLHAREIHPDLVVGQDERALHGVLQLAHVAGPAMRANGRRSPAAENCLVVPSASFSCREEVLGQELGVALALAQGGSAMGTPRGGT